MKNFTKGVLVGVGIGLLFAPLRGQDTRRVIKERYNEWRNSLPEDSRLNQYASQVSHRVEKTRGDLQNYAQQAISKVKDTSNKTQQSVQQAKQSSQDVASKTRQSATSTRPGSPPNP